MATINLVRGMGSFFKECEHPESRWPRCPHEYKIRYRNAAGRQTEESGFATQEKAKARLAEVYQARKNAPQSQRKAERIQKYGPMQFEPYVEEWKADQRHLGAASLRHLDSLLEHHLYPAFRSRRMGTFDHKVVEAFIQTMERNGVGLATQPNAFDKLKSILLDAHRVGLYDENPFDGVKPPQYDPKRAVIPSPTQLQGIRTAGDDAFVVIADLMSGCGLRNGEATAVNINNIVADDVYRVTDQVNQTTKDYAPLKHRKEGDYRDVPLPARVKLTIEWYADKYGTVDGYLLRHPVSPTTSRSPTSPSGWATRASTSPSRSTATSCPGRSAAPPSFSTSASLPERTRRARPDGGRPSSSLAVAQVTQPTCAAASPTHERRTP
ncbi:site-specific integrase [Kitasatospora sp. NPDC085464]|uniref:site-specific integrase n=1 Tax=Kitasatospora sp. NPDC085464 TaxID=3364063 RepID=UPI0037C7C7BB